MTSPWRIPGAASSVGPLPGKAVEKRSKQWPAAQLNYVFFWGVCVLWVLGAYTRQEAYRHSLPLPTPLRKCDNPTKLEFSSSLNSLHPPKKP